MKKVILLVIAMTMIPMSAMADLSKRDKSLLYGIAGTLMFQHIYKNRNGNSRHEQPHHPHRNNDQIDNAYREGVEDRRRQELEQKRYYAYQCGRYGSFCDML